MRPFRLLLLALIAFAMLTSAAQAAPKVHLELVTEKGFPITGAQQWYKLFTELGVTGLRIRSATTRDEVGAEKAEGSNAYRVTGILTADNKLHLPGRTFTARDQAGIRKWLDALGDEGVEAVTQRRSAFGLLPKQVEEVHADLSKPVDFSTKGVPLSEALDKLGRRLTAPIAIEPAARDELARASTSEELQGLSSGTALAIMLRPAGLVLVPTRPPGGQLTYRVGSPVAGQESWPLGWTPEKQPREILPNLYVFINVAIEDTPVLDVLANVAERLETPVFIDQNALALHGVELEKATATVPGKKLTYSLILQKVLYQAKLKSELRVDEAGKPFFWITTIKPA